jgi:hypothetical protein
MLSGINERDATRKRLAAAKMRANSDANMINSAREIEKLSQQTLNNVKQALATAMMNHDTAKKNVESARGNMDKSRDEVKAAEAQLKATEERLTVIDVDVLSPAAASPKRRKVSVFSTESIHTAVPQMIVAPAAATAVQSSRGIGDIRGAASVSNDAAATRASVGSDGGSLEVVVLRGCRLPEVNGTFRREIRNGLVRHPLYVKSGHWKGENCTFEIRRSRAYNWWIEVKCTGFHTSVQRDTVHGLRLLQKSLPGGTADDAAEEGTTDIDDYKEDRGTWTLHSTPIFQLVRGWANGFYSGKV